MRKTFEPIMHIAKHEEPYIADYRMDVAYGGQHPLEIETEDWHFIQVGSLTMNILTSAQAKNLDEEIKNVEDLMLKRPEVHWALDNSFDGLYTKRAEDYVRGIIVYSIHAYLKAEQATYWKLKFGEV